MNNYQQQTTIGVVSDSHIPDRVLGIPPAIIEGLKRHDVDLIFHAGDISNMNVLKQLNRIAPVQAVRGNRDIFIWARLPHEIQMNIGGVPIVLTHGHGGWWEYIYDKLVNYRMGYSFERYQHSLLRHYPDAKVIIFGHTHRSINRKINGTLYFNPGSCTLPPIQARPSFGILKITNNGEVTGEIFQI